MRLSGFTLAALASLALACHRSPATLGPSHDGSAGGERDAPPATEPHSPSPDACPTCPIKNWGDAGLAACAGSWSPGTLPTPPWATSPPATCEASLSDPTPQMYDDCKYNPTWLPYWQCGGPAPGAIFCQANVYSGVGRLTESCRADSDCPAGMVCAFSGIPVSTRPGIDGWCEKKCTGADPAECIRCDLECDSEGVCFDRSPDAGPPCAQDCQCNGGICYSTGHCLYGTGVVPTAICGADCPCKGGKCVGAGSCCYTPDGGLQGSASPACAM